MNSNKVRAVISSTAIAFLISCGGGEQTSTETTSAETGAATEAATEQAAAQDPAALAAQGKELYTSTCASCHGELGKGDGPGSAALDPKPRDFSNAEYMSGLTDTDIRNTIKYGGAIKGMPQMPSHPQFSEEQLNAIVAYVRTLDDGAPAS